MRRKILITGASSGIGLVLANNLAERHDVMVTGRRPKDEVADNLAPNIVYVQASQENPQAATQAVCDALLKEGWVRLDNAILNAGTGFAAHDALDDVDKIWQTLDVNLTATLLLSRALYPWLLKSNGTLSLIGSVARKGQSLVPAYSATKGALHGFARALRSEWAGRVTVQMLHPGPTQTDMHAKAGHDPGPLRAIFLRPESMATMIEHAVASKRSPLTLSWLRYLCGGSVIGRKL